MNKQNPGNNLNTNGIGTFFHSSNLFLLFRAVFGSSLMALFTFFGRENLTTFLARQILGNLFLLADTFASRKMTG